MKVTDEQFEKAYQVYNDTTGGSRPSVRAAIESLPEPLPHLRPLSEMPPEVPEGAIKLTGFQRTTGDWAIGDYGCSSDTHFGFILPPLPEPAKPDSLLDELVTALESVILVADRDTIIFNSAKAVLAKAKGGQQ